MALKTAARGGQHHQYAEFIGSFNDTVVDVNGVTKTLGSVFADGATFEAIKMPVGAVLTGGELIVETQGAGPTVYTVSIGTAANAANILAATTLASAAGTRVALTGLGLLCNDGSNIRATIASTVANATAGKFRIRVSYTIDGKVDSVVTN